MSHAWNACGANAPRGFKSHILRSITPVLSQSRGLTLRRPPPGLTATSTQKTVLPITLTGSMSPSPLHPRIGEYVNQKHLFQVQFLGTLAGGGRALRSSATTAIRSTPARGRNCVILVLKSRQLPGAPHIYSESEAITDFAFPHSYHPRIGLAT